MRSQIHLDLGSSPFFLFFSEKSNFWIGMSSVSDVDIPRLPYINLQTVTSFAVAFHSSRHICTRRCFSVSYISYKEHSLTLVLP